jgi:hypothetical protein
VIISVTSGDHLMICLTVSEIRRAHAALCQPAHPPGHTGRVSEQIRAAAQPDIAAMTRLASMRREQYGQFQPLFWRPAADAADKHRPYLASLVASDEVISLVSDDAGQLTGFLIATLAPAPPVYDPGGLTCQIDDFAVATPGRWPTTGVQLLRAGLAQAARRGAVQAVVVTGHLDKAKRQALRACGLEVASEWWVTPQPLEQGQHQDHARRTGTRRSADADRAPLGAPRRIRPGQHPPGRGG